jgi:hypothetical protein
MAILVIPLRAEKEDTTPVITREVIKIGTTTKTILARIFTAVLFFLLSYFFFLSGEEKPRPGRNLSFETGKQPPRRTPPPVCSFLSSVQRT